MEFKKNMDIEFVASRIDQAGMNIAKELQKLYPVTIIDEPPISAEHFQSKAKIIVFVTKHDSVSKIPSFCVHTQGNWGNAELGGKPQTIAPCPVVLKNKLYVNLTKVANQLQPSYDVVNEATHHGPDLNIPCVFIEIGSTINEWEIPLNAQVITQTIHQTLQEYVDETSNIPCYFGIGGPHTCTNFNSLAAQEKILLGHVCPNYAIMDVTPNLINQAINKHSIRPKIVVDWKALNSAQRSHITKILEECNITFIKLKELKKQLQP